MFLHIWPNFYYFYRFLGASQTAKNQSMENEEEEKFLLPPVEKIIDKANKVKVTQDEIMILKKEYDQKYAINPPKEIKRLPTFFEIISEEEKELSSSNKNIANLNLPQV